MTKTLNATVNVAVLTLDEPLPLAPGTKVVVVVTADEAKPGSDVDPLDELDRLCEEMPINCGGLKYTRDQLHERR
jgi:hypothetical protein